MDHLKERSIKPGLRALSILGWGELGISLILALIGLPMAGLFFTFTAILVGTLAGQVQNGRLWYDRETGRRISRKDLPPHPRMVTIAMIVLSGGLMIGAALTALSGSAVHAMLLTLWAIAITILLGRIRVSS